MEKENYLQLFLDSGWEYVEEMAGWHYFRQLARPGEELEIYTDAESKIGKYQRLLTFLGILTLPLIFITINMNYGYSSIIQVMIFLLFVLYVYAIIRILIRIRQLKRI